MSGVLTKLQDLMEGLDWEDVKQLCKNNVRTVLLVGVSVSAWWLLFKKPRGIPPGPSFTLPLIGDLLRLGGEADMRVSLRTMRKQHGDMFSLYLGNQLVVCLNGFEMIKEALVKNADAFSDRPPLFINNFISGGRGIVFSSGQLWKEQRKFALETLREFGFGRTILEDKIHEEIGFFVESITKQQGKPYDMCRLTQAAIANVIASLVYGQRFDYANSDFKQFLQRSEDNFKAAGSTAILNAIPSLRFLPGDLFEFGMMRRNVRYVEGSIINPAIEEHEENFDENNNRDFISSYLKEMKRVEKTGEKSYINKPNLIKSISDLFVAGTETTSTTILWTILYLLHHPNIQARCYKEVQDVVGSGRQPSLKDRDSMQYTQAVILEVLRLANIAFLGAPHTVTEDTMFRGYLIPKDTLVLANLDSVLMDDEVWGDAAVFRPERFLDADGQVIKKEEFIPFSLGRRVCLGEPLAKMELFLFLTTLVQRFEFLPVDPDNLPTFKGSYGITHAPSKYEVLAKLRL